MLIKLNDKIGARPNPMAWIIGPVRAPPSTNDFTILPDYRTKLSTKTHSAVEFSDVQGKVEDSGP
jgi:hypothetical protein